MVIKRLGLIQILLWSAIRGNVIHNLRGFYNVLFLRNKEKDPRNEPCGASIAPHVDDGCLWLLWAKPK